LFIKCFLFPIKFVDLHTEVHADLLVKSLFLYRILSQNLKTTNSSKGLEYQIGTVTCRQEDGPLDLAKLIGAALQIFFVIGTKELELASVPQAKLENKICRTFQRFALINYVSL
jgi:hypothetical protein